MKTLDKQIDVDHNDAGGSPAGAGVLCVTCGGAGYETRPVCCNGGQSECGDDGCTGPEPFQEICSTCKGTGLAEEEEPPICASCNGSGEGSHEFTKCIRCNGMGIEKH